MDVQLLEYGGKREVENQILECLHTTGGCNPALLGTMIGIPEPLIKSVLYTLEDKGYIRVAIDGRLWSINEEAFT